MLALNIEWIKKSLVSLIMSDYKKILNIYRTLEKICDSQKSQGKVKALLPARTQTSLKSPHYDAIAAESVFRLGKKIKEAHEEQEQASYANFNKRIEDEINKLDPIKNSNIIAFKTKDKIKFAIDTLLTGGLTPEDIFDSLFLFRPSSFFTLNEQSGMYQLNKEFMEFISKRSEIVQKAASFLSEKKFEQSGWSKMILNGELTYFLVLPYPFKVFIMVQSTISWYGLSLLSGMAHGNMNTSTSIRVSVNDKESGKMMKKPIIIQKSEEESFDINDAATKVSNAVATIALRLSEISENFNELNEEKKEKLKIFYDPSIDIKENGSLSFKKVKNALQTLNSFNSANVNFYNHIYNSSLFVPNIFLTPEIMTSFAESLKKFAEHYYMINFSKTTNVSASKGRIFDKVHDILSENKKILTTISRWNEIKNKILFKENEQKSSITAEYMVPKDLNIQYVKEFYRTFQNLCKKSADDLKKFIKEDKTLNMIYNTNRNFFEKSDFIKYMADGLKKTKIKSCVLTVSQKQTSAKYQEFYFLIFLGDVKKTFILFETSAMKRGDAWKMKDKNFGSLRLHLLDSNFKHMDPSFYSHGKSPLGDVKIPRLTLKMTRAKSNIEKSETNPVIGLEINFLAMCFAAYMIEKYSSHASDVTPIMNEINEQVARKLAYVIGFNRYVEEIGSAYFGAKHNLDAGGKKTTSVEFDINKTLKANFDDNIRGKVFKQSVDSKKFPADFSDDENKNKDDEKPMEFTENEIENLGNFLQKDFEDAEKSKSKPKKSNAKRKT